MRFLVTGWRQRCQRKKAHGLGGKDGSMSALQPDLRCRRFVRQISQRTRVRQWILMLLSALSAEAFSAAILSLKAVTWGHNNACYVAPFYGRSVSEIAARRGAANNQKPELES